jgi:acyl transferase domain-containing protein
MNRPRPYEIAIVGMGCRFPGASDLTAYFENILSGKDCTRSVPPDRWKAEVFHDPTSSAGHRLPSCRGGYLDSPIPFDASAHGIMPRTVLGGEPEQFLVLDAATAALADAGLAIEDLKHRAVHVVIGRGNYFNRGNLIRLQHGRMIEQTVAILAAFHPEWSEADLDLIRSDLRASLPPFEAATIPGQLTNATAGRLAHRFDLSGASFVVDAASASSLVAVDLAVRALIDRSADLAVAGAVYLEADVDFPLVFRQLNALSPSGTARPFAEDADGMVPGEGVGALILKRRADAERDGDRIYAVIQGIGLASDGKSAGLAAPSARGHLRAMRRAYRKSGIDPATVMLVEGHGLGVPAADRAEIKALRAVFKSPDRGQRVLGAVSSMIGHAMPAAGMAGLIKSALALYHRVLPPTLHSEKPHPQLLATAPQFALNPVARPWIHGDDRFARRAGVNAFGFAGINAHAILEEHSASADAFHSGALRHWDTEAILLSAPDRPALVERIRELVAWIKGHRDNELVDVAYSLNCRVSHASEAVRLGLLASSLSELEELLTPLVTRLADPSCRSIRDRRGIYFWDEPLLHGDRPGLAFLFPGEGSQYPGMLADLCFHFPEVRRLFDTADRIAFDSGESSPPSDHLFAPRAQSSDQLWSTATAVNVVLNAQWALYQVLTRIGLRPDAVLGHSSGEILALSAGGVFPTDRALERKLGRLGTIMSGFESSGDLPAAVLVAVATHRDRAVALCRDLGASGVEVAMDNCPHQVVLAVPPAEHLRVVECLRREQILFEELPFARAYHTPGFRPVVGAIAEFFNQMPFGPPEIPIYSCASHARMPESPDAIRDLAVAQWTQTVAFRETIEAMHADGFRVFIDVGARGNLAGFVEDTLRGRPSFAVAANMPRRSGLTQLNHLVAATFAQGASLKADYLYARRRPQSIDWSSPEPSKRAVVEIQVGFPEMLPSAALLETLSSRRQDPPATPSPAFEVSADQAPILPPALPLPLPYTNGHQNGNGNGHHDHASHVTAVAGSRHTPRLTLDVDLDETSRCAAWQPSSELEISFDQSLANSDEDRVMRGFQDVMQSFLEAQREVMAAYLSGPIDASLSVDATGTFSLPYAEYSDTFTSDDESVAPSWNEPAPALGAWVGEIRRLVPWTEVETVLLIEAEGDPVAEHHTLGGRKISAADPTLLGLPVLPFAVMAEMTAQVAALIVPPGLVLTGLSDVRAHKWVRYETEPVHIELRGRRLDSDHDTRIWVGIFNRGIDGTAESSRPVFEATAVFDRDVPQPETAERWELNDARPSRFTANSVYGEQWLFHGPLFQAIARMGELSGRGIEGDLRVLPLEPLVRQGESTTFYTDLVVIDNFTQLLGAWGLDYLAEGDVMFPLRMELLEIQGDRPEVGTLVHCQIAIHELERHRIRVDAQFVRPDGTVWMRIKNWQDWRFHWPGRYRDSFRQPRDHWVGEELPIDDQSEDIPTGVKAVWLEPPGDMGRPVWRDVLEFTQLGPAERAEHLELAYSEESRSRQLWGRVAAKEAVRRLWADAERPATYPADLAIIAPPDGHPRLALAHAPETHPMPAIAIAHTEGVAVGVAALDPRARLGVGVEPIVEPALCSVAAPWTQTERTILSRWSGDALAEWLARFACAKAAAAQSEMLCLPDDLARLEVVSCDELSGTILVRIACACDNANPDSVDRTLRVFSARRADRAWAWTLGKGIES